MCKLSFQRLVKRPLAVALLRRSALRYTETGTNQSQSKEHKALFLSIKLQHAIPMRHSHEVAPATPVEMEPSCVGISTGLWAPASPSARHRCNFASSVVCYIAGCHTSTSLKSHLPNSLASTMVSWTAGGAAASSASAMTGNHLDCFFVLVAYPALLLLAGAGAWAAAWIVPGATPPFRA